MNTFTDTVLNFPFEWISKVLLNFYFYFLQTHGKNTVAKGPIEGCIKKSTENGFVTFG